MKDEWNTDEIVEDHVITNRRLMIRGDVPGTGKSFICKHLQEKNYNVIFVVPTNNSKQECGVEAMTINKCFGISYGDERLESVIIRVLMSLYLMRFIFITPQVGFNLELLY